MVKKDYHLSTLADNDHLVCTCSLSVWPLNRMKEHCKSSSFFFRKCPVLMTIQYKVSKLCWHKIKYLFDRVYLKLSQNPSILLYAIYFETCVYKNKFYDTNDYRISLLRSIIHYVQNRNQCFSYILRLWKQSCTG